MRNTFLKKIPVEIRDYYTNTKFENEGDNLIWIDDTSGEFSSKKYIKTFNSRHSNVTWGEAIWQSWIPKRVSLFCWRLIHKGLPLDEKIKLIGINLASRCQCCYSEEESFNHLFFGGEWATKIWSFLAKLFDCKQPKSVTEFIDNWTKKVRKKSFESNIGLGLALHGLWYIWHLRNERLHGEKAKIKMEVFTRWTIEMMQQNSKIRSDTKAAREILTILGVPLDFKCNIRGVWKIWKPCSKGNTMDLYVSEENSVGAIICRDSKGHFLLAANRGVRLDGTTGAVISIMENFFGAE